MSDPLPSPHTSSETESIGPVQLFEGESLPIPPGTLASPRPQHRTDQRGLRWLVVAGAFLAALLVGWLLGRWVFNGS
jgi:hypothetical protein